MKHIFLALALIPAFAMTMEQGSFPFGQLPGDVQRLIQLKAMHNIPQPELAGTLRNLANFTLVNKSFHRFINKPANTQLLLTTLAATVHHVTPVNFAHHVKNMPGIQSVETQSWLAHCRQLLQHEDELIEAINGGNFAKLHNTLKNISNLNFYERTRGLSPLHHAVESNNPDMVRAIIAAGANVNLQKKDTFGQTPLFLAIQYGYNDIVAILLAAQANPNLSTKNQRSTPLQCAARDGNARGTQLLLKAGARKDYQCVPGYTATMWAAYSGKTETLKTLIEAKAHLDLQDNDGNTALHWAISEGRDNTAKILLEAGANPNITSSKHGTALELARHKKCIDIEALLLQHGAPNKKAKREQKASI